MRGDYDFCKLNVNDIKTMMIKVELAVKLP